MFYTLLLVTFGIALAVSFLVARFFERPIGSILARVVADDVSRGWQRYLTFAIYVVGVSGGVRLYELERYIEGGAFRAPDEPVPVLTGERWVLEVYRTVIETLQSLAWMLLVFFLVALIAYVIVRAFELKRGRPDPPSPPLRESAAD